MTDNNQNFTHLEASGDQNPIFSVSEISQALKRSVESNFSHVRVRGEISRFTLARSGHMYMTMKDQSSVLDAVCWKGTSNNLSVKPEDGIEVIATGRLTTYPGRSNYQIVIEQMEVAGEGALLKLLEERRKKLLAEGLFEKDLKRELPYLPECIGVVTSPTGAVIRDILHRLDDRFPRHVLLWPVNVQGDGAAEQITLAIEGFNRIRVGDNVPRPDLLILARGGGSLEDLWTFNEEIVVRAVANSDIPLISAVGHETDTTLIDFASDKRAPTPSAAAEIAVPVRSNLFEKLESSSLRLHRAMNRSYKDSWREVEGLSRGLPNPKRITEEPMQRLDNFLERMTNAGDFYLKNISFKIQNLSARLISPRHYIAIKQNEFISQFRSLAIGYSDVIRKKSHELDLATLKLEAISFQRTLDRGFALVTDVREQTVLSAAKTETGMEINIRFGDGSITGNVLSKNGLKTKKNKLIEKKRRKKKEEIQGSLL